MTQAAAVAKGEEAPDARRTATRDQRAEALESRLERKLVVARKQRGVIRFFAKHRSLLTSREHAFDARRRLVRARRLLARTARQITELRRAILVRSTRLRAASSPRAAICTTFRGYCEEAVAVAWCESRLRTSARNGEYLGLFQMGSLARRLFGHGSTAREQSAAAHRYFVVSGRDWTPWSCKP